MKNNSAWDAERILRTAGSYWESCTLQTGVKLEIFTEIGEGDLAAGEIAQKLDGDVRGITMLLNALTAMGLLIKKDNRYANTAEGKSLLVQQSPQYIGYLILHHSQVINSWTQLSEAVRSGEQVRRQPYNEEEERENFLMGMFNLAMANAPQIAAQIDLSKRRHLLDLGGGPGTYAIHFCLANPQLRATIFDLPTTRPFALRTVKQFGLEDRIDFMAGNYVEENIDGSYDAAWLSHVLHGEGADDCQRIIQKVVSVLEPGGLILIQDFILEDTFDHPLFPAIFSLNMLIHTPQGQSYSETQIKEMLVRAHVKEISRMPYRGPNDSGIIYGTV
ncbi:MAG: methyltransferase domain-containing protein [Deltaproteobacteria bacterium]|nr:methyltransferase domain-containing protein [Deltaproteobacteria bacterium]